MDIGNFGHFGSTGRSLKVICLICCSKCLTSTVMRSIQQKAVQTNGTKYIYVGLIVVSLLILETTVSQVK